MRNLQHYFHMKTKIFTDFKICISVPLNIFTFFYLQFLIIVQNFKTIVGADFTNKLKQLQDLNCCKNAPFCSQIQVFFKIFAIVNFAYVHCIIAWADLEQIGIGIPILGHLIWAHKLKKKLTLQIKIKTFHLQHLLTSRILNHTLTQ